MPAFRRLHHWMERKEDTIRLYIVGVIHGSRDLTGRQPRPWEAVSLHRASGRAIHSPPT